MAPTFLASERIRRRAEFQLVYERGLRAQGRFMTVFILGTDRKVARLGIAATRKLGTAVVRNRAKRVARELFRLHKLSPGLDVVVVPRRDMLDAPWPALEADYRNACNRYRRR